MGEPEFERPTRERLWFRPIPIWDPSPELFRRLDDAAQLELARVQLDVNVKILESYLDGYRQTAEILAKQR